MEPLLPLKALADRNRLRLVAALAEYEELCACQLTELLGVSGATASRHLAQLAASGLLASRKDGRWVWFRLQETPATAGLLDWLLPVLQASGDWRADRPQLRRIAATDPETLCRQQRGERCCPAD